MNILRRLMLFVALFVFANSYGIPIRQDPPIALSIEFAKTAIIRGSYGDAIVHLRIATLTAKLEHTVLPKEVEQLRHIATKSRSQEISSEIVLAYHQIDVERTLALADEAILISKEDGIRVSDEIMRIKLRTERHYFEPVFYGVPPHLVHRKLIV